MRSPEDQLRDEVHDDKALLSDAIGDGQHDGAKEHQGCGRHAAPLAPNSVTQNAEEAHAQNDA